MTAPAIQDNWVLDLAFEVALEYHTDEELQRRFGLDNETYYQILDLPEFKKAAAEAKRDIDEKGTQFRVLARKLATSLLPSLAAIGFDTAAEQSDRINAIKEVFKAAGFHEDQTSAPVQVKFITNLSMGEKDSPGRMVAVSREPERVVHEQ